MYYICPVCNEELAITPYYRIPHGKVCEDCYEGGDYEETKEPVILTHQEIGLLEKQLKLINGRVNRWPAMALALKTNER